MNLIHRDKLPEVFINSLASKFIDDEMYQIHLDYDTDYSYVVDSERNVLMYYDASCNGYHPRGLKIVHMSLRTPEEWGYMIGDSSDIVWTGYADVFIAELKAAAQLKKEGLI